MQNYDMVYIIRPHISDEDKKAMNEKLQSFITKNNGEILHFEDQGVQSFAQELKKENKGHYYNLQFSANGKGLDELKNYLGVTEQFFRYLIVKLESIQDPQPAG